MPTRVAKMTKQNKNIMFQRICEMARIYTAALVQISITVFAVSWVHTIYIYPSKILYELKELNKQQQQQNPINLYQC